MDLKIMKIAESNCVRCGKTSLILKFSLACLAILFALFCILPGVALCESSDPFRIGFSKMNFVDVNENDALAAVRIWAQEIAQTRGITADPQPRIFQNISEVETALHNGTVDCITLTIDEYEKVSGLLTKDNIVIGVVSGSTNVEYLLLVNTKSNFKELKDLRGRSLVLIESLETTLAAAWLDITLDEEGLDLAEVFFGQIKPLTKTEKGVLSVFFGQIDACVVTRKGFETMVELNPQIGRELRILAVSPPVVKSAFFFRADYSSPSQNKIMSEITSWHLYPESRQILTIFKTDRLEKHPVESLNSTLELIAAHRSLLEGKKAGIANKNPASSQPGIDR